MTGAEKTGAPARRERLRPLELIAVAAALGIFTGLIVFMGTREWNVAAIFFGVAFVVSLVALAMLSLAFTPADERPDAESSTPSDEERPLGH